MTSIVTIHGTFASGPEQGEAWWQLGSNFGRTLTELVLPEDGLVEQVPFVWDGANTEVARRSAGADLLKKLVKLETAGRRYILIGHSHGGSVIANALLDAAQARRELPLLSRWITIGTPFISTRKGGWSFSLLSDLEKVLVVALVLAAILFFVASNVDYAFLNAAMGNAQPKASPTLNEAWSNSAAAMRLLVDDVLLLQKTSFGLLGGLALVYALKLLYEARESLTARLDRISDANYARASSLFGNKWLPINHQVDEAVGGLYRLGSIRLSALVQISSVKPKSLLLALSILGGIIWLGLLVASSGLSPKLTNIPQIIAFYATPQRLAGAVVLLGVLMLGSLATLAISLFVVWVGRHVYSWSSELADRVIQGWLTSRALGFDLIGETAEKVSWSPPFLKRDIEYLPEWIGAELALFKDAADAAVLRALRQEFHHWLATGGASGNLAAICGLLDLIHTNYFSSPLCVKLLAVAISQSPGFSPAPALSDDQDYPMLAKWYNRSSAADPDPERSRPTHSQRFFRSHRP
jgi:pimeloyl-ACP methyl ester carboxylesterase